MGIALDRLLPLGAESSKFGHGSTRLQAKLEREPARADRSMKFDALEVAPN